MVGLAMRISPKMDRPVATNELDDTGRHKLTRCDFLYAVHRFVEIYGGEEPDEKRTSLSYG